jgi:Flp pilus assembly protein TadG
MAQHKISKAAKRLRSLCSDRSGNVGVIFGLAVLPMMLLLGSAVDFQRVASTRARLQAALDAGAIAAAEQPNLSQFQRQALAQNTISANLGTLASQLNLTVSETEPATNYYKVTASASLPTTFMKLANLDSVAISAHSAAKAIVTTSGVGGSGCVLSLDTSAIDSLWDIGNASVVLTGCDMFDNSNSSDALDVGGSATLSARSVAVTGGVSGLSKITTTAGVMANTGTAVADPYASTPTPAYSGCNYNSYSAQGVVTLNPGVYCGGLSVNAGAVVTLNPGLYVFDQGSFTVNGQATVTNSTGPSQLDGVTLAFTSSTMSNYATATINGGANLNLTAPKSGSTSGGVPGVLFYGDRNMPVGTSFKLNGGSTQNFTGAIYLPKAALSYAGGASSTGCTQLVADTIKFTGSANIAVNACSGAAITSFGVSSRSVALTE